MKSTKTVVFSLTKKGCLDYSQQMISFLDNCDVYLSENTPTDDFNNFYRIKTYNNSREFVVNSFFFIFYAIKIILNIKKNNKNQNIVFYFTVFHPWNCILILYAKILKIPTILTIHDFHFHSGEKYKLGEWIQRVSAQLATNLIFLSKSEANKVPTNSLKSKISIIPHPTITKFGHFKKHTFQNKPGVLFLGRISLYKGVQVLYGALPFISHQISHLTVAGELLDDTICLADSEKVVQIYKHLDDKEIIELINSHDILILPYIEASQSGILMIGASLGIPMIISDLEGLREQIAADQAYWILPGSSQSIADAVSWYCKRENYDNIVLNMAKTHLGINQDIEKKMRKIIFNMQKQTT